MASPPRLSARKTSHFNGESVTLGGGTPCAACGANVYVAERREANGLTFHTDCFRCAVCRKKLNAEWFMSDEDALLCRVHHSQRNMFRGQLVALPERIVPKPVVTKPNAPDVASPSEEAPLTSLFPTSSTQKADESVDVDDLVSSASTPPKNAPATTSSPTQPRRWEQSWSGSTFPVWQDAAGGSTSTASLWEWDEWVTKQDDDFEPSSYFSCAPLSRSERHNPPPRALPLDFSPAPATEDDEDNEKEPPSSPSYRAMVMAKAEAALALPDGVVEGAPPPSPDNKGLQRLYSELKLEREAALVSQKEAESARRVLESARKEAAELQRLTEATKAEAEAARERLVDLEEQTQQTREEADSARRVLSMARRETAALQEQQFNLQEELVLRSGRLQEQVMEAEGRAQSAELRAKELEEQVSMLKKREANRSWFGLGGGGGSDGGGSTATGGDGAAYSGGGKQYDERAATTAPAHANLEVPRGRALARLHKSYDLD